jgi:hypothetical protein
MLRKLSVIPALALVALFSFSLTARAEEKGAAAKPETVEGKIGAVKADAKSFTVKAKDGKEVEISWNDKTTLAWKPEMKDKPAPTAADLKADVEVSVTIEKDAAGKLWAKSIEVHHAA